MMLIHSVFLCGRVSCVGGGCRSRVVIKFQQKYDSPLEAEKYMSSTDLSESFQTLDIQNNDVRTLVGILKKYYDMAYYYRLVLSSAAKVDNLTLVIQLFLLLTLQLAHHPSPQQALPPSV